MVKLTNNSNLSKASKFILLCLVVLLLSSCGYQKKLDYQTVEANLVELDLNSDSMMVYDAGDSVVKYSELEHKTSMDEFSQDTVSTMFTMDLESKESSVDFIPNGKYHVSNMQVIDENEYHVLVSMDPANNGYKLIIMENWGKENEQIIDEYLVERPSFAPKMAKVGNTLLYLRFTESHVQLMSINDSKANVVLDDFETGYLPMFRNYVDSDGKNASFVLNANDTRSTLYYTVNGNWQSVKTDMFIYSAVPVGKRFLVNENEANGDSQYYWFKPETQEFEEIETPDNFATYDYQFLDGMTFVAATHDFDLCLAHFESDYSLVFNELDDLGDVDEVYSIFGVSKDSFVIEASTNDNSMGYYLVELSN